MNNIVFMNKIVTIQFYHQGFKKRSVQISDNCAPCFSRINFIVIPSYIELLVGENPIRRSKQSILQPWGNCYRQIYKTK